MFFQGILSKHLHIDQVLGRAIGRRLSKSFWNASCDCTALDNLTILRRTIPRVVGQFHRYEWFPYGNLKGIRVQFAIWSEGNNWCNPSGFCVQSSYSRCLVRHWEAVSKRNCDVLHNWVPFYPIDPMIFESSTVIPVVEMELVIKTYSVGWSSTLASFPANIQCSIRDCRFNWIQSFTSLENQFIQCFQPMWLILVCVWSGKSQFQWSFRIN